mmetsp:Transcript_82203/g.214503  ORF Transcript_82203/g.214503 Transcript_82203/m.214503 type:complete len:254 (-) Transcript_82203:283-1044(-)
MSSVVSRATAAVGGPRTLVSSASRGTARARRTARDSPARPGSARAPGQPWARAASRSPKAWCLGTTWRSGAGTPPSRALGGRSTPPTLPASTSRWCHAALVARARGSPELSAHQTLTCHARTMCSSSTATPPPRRRRQRLRHQALCRRLRPRPRRRGRARPRTRSAPTRAGTARAAAGRGTTACMRTRTGPRVSLCQPSRPCPPGSPPMSGELSAFARQGPLATSGSNATLQRTEAFSPEALPTAGVTAGSCR